ncbi:hypothetical protein JKP88DRAFT_41998 [Tribonema minus]|uniref:BBSome-interacting protein 1 n=1 Tax=Tribonema minus TaxID=303371 RepID=A0A835Z1E9_9STRA|nr:hypothetical protein JKP88DRAFT_41998 [Tribonema minus]
MTEPVLKEVIAKKGLVFSEKPSLHEVLCKPKLLPIKSVALEKLEALEAAANRPPEPQSEEDHDGDS